MSRVGAIGFVPSLILLVNFGEDFSFNHGIEGSTASALKRLRSDFAPRNTSQKPPVSANQLRAGALRPTENDFAMLRLILLALLLQVGGVLLMVGWARDSHLACVNPGVIRGYPV